MQALLRDDFLDDPSLEPDYDNCPVKLPLLECKFLDEITTALYVFVFNNLFLSNIYVVYICCILGVTTALQPL